MSRQNTYEGLKSQGRRLFAIRQWKFEKGITWIYYGVYFIEV